MLSFLKLRVAGFGAGETGLRIWNSNGTLRYAYDDAPLDGEPSLIVRVPGRIASDFLLKLQDIHVYRWKKSYQPSSKSKKLHLAHSEWNLIYKEDNGQIEEFSGINAYPRKWNQFMELVTNLVQESTAAHLNGLARFDMTLTDMTKGQRADGKEAQITYTETLSLDRYEDTLSYVIRIGEKTQIKHEYKIPEMIDYLLANCEQYLKEHDETGYRLPEHGKPSLSVNVRYRNGRNVSFRRSYNRYGVPDDWNEFLDDFYSAIKYFGLFGSTFDPDLYRHGGCGSAVLSCRPVRRHAPCDLGRRRPAASRALPGRGSAACLPPYTGEPRDRRRALFPSDGSGHRAQNESPPHLHLRLL